MKKSFTTCFIVLMLSTFGYANFLFLNIEERVKNNNFIVTGKLINVSETETEEFRISKGRLIIEKVIDGNFVNSKGQKLKSRDEIKVEWQNYRLISCQFGFTENEQGIWFLTVDNEGNIESLSPNTKSSIAELAEVKLQLKKQKRENNSARLINLQNDIQEIIQPDLVNQSTEETVIFNYSVKSKETEYSPFSALLVVLASISLYCLLYRSKFKIR